jgi:hypothetical protein
MNDKSTQLTKERRDLRIFYLYPFALSRVPDSVCLGVGQPQMPLRR